MRCHITRWIPLARVVAAAATLLAVGGCSSAGGGESERDPSRWSWLAENGGTYWYVPSENLQAFGWQIDAPEAAQSIDDQTVWHIERYENGYVFGPVMAKFAGFPRQCQYLIGSVTPTGQVYLTFNQLQVLPVGTPALTTGFGDMVRADGAWTFSMQMASGSADAQVTHWASMMQCTPDKSCWADLPGVGGSIVELLAACGAT